MPASSGWPTTQRPIGLGFMIAEQPHHRQPSFRAAHPNTPPGSLQSRQEHVHGPSAVYPPPAMFRKGARWCGARAGLNREDAIEPPGGAQRTSDDRCRASIGNGGCVGREWAAPPPGTPNHAGKGEKKVRRAPLALNDGRQCREVLQGVGEGRPLRDDERREPEAAASHEAGFASRHALPPGPRCMIR